MASKDRERQLARERYERQQARRAADEAKRRQRTKLAAIVTAAIVVVAGAVWWGVSRGDDAVTATPETSTSPTPSATPTAAPIDCTEAPAAQPEAKQYDAPPEQKLVLDGTRTYGVTLETNCGNVKIEFDAVQAPDDRQRLHPARQRRVLQRHPVPPADHAGHLRPAVRRPDRHGLGWPRLRDPGREPARGRPRQLPGRHRGDGQLRERRTPTAASSSWSTRTPRCRRTTRSSARSSRVSTSSRASRPRALRAVGPTAPPRSRSASSRPSPTSRSRQDELT